MPRMRVVEFLAERFAPARSAAHRGAVRQGQQRRRRAGHRAPAFHALPAAALHVVLLAAPERCGRRGGQLRDAAQRADARWCRNSPPEARHATLVVDALLGTGITGPATGACWRRSARSTAAFRWPKWWPSTFPPACRAIRANRRANVARADYTVTFTAPKLAHVLPPNCDSTGELIVGPSAAAGACYDVKIDVADRAGDVQPRAGAAAARGHKGTFGHVLVVAGSRGKTGAAAMCGLGALRAGAGLVTVASAESPSRRSPRTRRS
jgi:ADP-dependent NAD(P)H-hydrate dehydratase / NAD(P)H-hydrate epimerase